MFNRTRLLVIAAILMPGCSGVRAEEAERRLSQTIVEMQLLDTCQVFFEGDPIPLTVVLRNTSEKNMRTLDFDFSGGLGCHVIYSGCAPPEGYDTTASVYITPEPLYEGDDASADGDITEEPPDRPFPDGQRYSVPLPIRGTSVFVFDLLEANSVQAPLPPGTYNVSLSYHQYGSATKSGRIQELDLKSNEITIRVFPKEENQPKPQVEFSHPEEVQLRLVQPEHAFYQGEPIVLKARLTNGSKQDVGDLCFNLVGEEVKTEVMSGANALTVVSKSWVHVAPEPPNSFKDTFFYKPVKVQLPAESTTEFDFILLKELPLWFRDLPPGEYKVSLEHNRTGIRSPECVLPELLLKSNEITVTVVEPDTKLDRPPLQLQMHLTQPKEPFVEGEPIVLKASVTNTSDKDLGMVGFDMLGKNSDPNGRVNPETNVYVYVEPAPAGVKEREEGTEYRALKLPPKSTADFDLDLLKVGLAPERYPRGEYKLSLKFYWNQKDGTGVGGGDGDRVLVHSNEITLRVVPDKNDP